jgi:hypothetical protein
MQSVSPNMHFRMALLLVSVPRLCLWSEGLPPSLPWPAPTRIFWFPAAPNHPQTFCLCFVHLVSAISHRHNHMSRPRGRSRRGSPWRPRRPSVSPPDSPSTCSSPPLRAEPHFTTPPAPPVMQFNGLAIIPRPLCSSSRLLLAPPVAEPAPTPLLASPRNLGGEPPSSRKHGNNGHPSSDSFNGEQIKDNLTILYGLVFELRQGVEDLQFRLQTTDEKVVVLLQLLSSMHEAFHSDPAGATSVKEPCAATDGENVTLRATSVKEPCAATDGGDVTMQCATESGLKQDGHETMDAEVNSVKRPLQDTTKNDVGTATKEEVEVQWVDGVTYVEEEPWTEDLHATWPGYMPDV